MQLRVLPTVLLPALASATFADPVPCAAPSGVVPVLNESLCFTELVPTNPSGISVRQYGFPHNATLVNALGGAAWPAGPQSGIAGVLSYFAGANDDQRDILYARTTPFMVQAHASYFTAHLQVSPTKFPDNFLIPRPNYPTTTSLVADNLDTIAAFQFNTTGFPYLEDCEEACGAIQNSTLPAGWAVNTSSAWSPTFVFYNGEAATNFTSECWMAVYKTTPAPAKNIVQLAESVPDLSILVELVVAGGLVDTLSGAGPFTVFAPTNEAFEALGNATLQKLLDPANKDQLVKILTYHVASGDFHSKDLTDHEQITTVEGDVVTAFIHNDKVFINQAQVVEADVDASNGVVHIVNGVLVPK